MVMINPRLPSLAKREHEKREKIKLCKYEEIKTKIENNTAIAVKASE